MPNFNNYNKCNLYIYCVFFVLIHFYSCRSFSGIMWDWMLCAKPCSSGNNIVAKTCHKCHECLVRLLLEARKLKSQHFTDVVGGHSWSSSQWPTTPGGVRASRRWSACSRTVSSRLQQRLGLLTELLCFVQLAVIKTDVESSLRKSIFPATF